MKFRTKKIISYVMALIMAVALVPTGIVGGKVTVKAASYTHDFTANGINSDFYTISGNLAKNKGTVEYNGMTLTQCLKMESATSITFNALEAGTLTLVFVETSGKVKVDGTSESINASGILSKDISAGSHTITKDGSINLFYIDFTTSGGAVSTATPLPSTAPTATPTVKPTATPTAKPSSAPTATPTTKPSNTPAATSTANPGVTTKPGLSVKYTHNFTTNNKDSEFYTITGNLATNKGTVNYNGTTLTQCLKMESATSITFNAPEAGMLTLVFVETSGKVKVDGTSESVNANGILSKDISAGSHTIAKDGSLNLFYIEFATYGEDLPAPTATPVPTATPTAKPTATPTAKPTATPTVKPTATPTAKPTATPTTKPTATPTTPSQPTSTPAATATPTPVTGSAITLRSGSLNLEGRVGINFYYTEENMGQKSVTAKFYVGSKLVAEDSEPKQNGEYKYVTCKLPVKQANEDVTVRFVDENGKSITTLLSGGEDKTNGYTYSIAKYNEALAENAKAKALTETVRVYGGHAKIYFGETSNDADEVSVDKSVFDPFAPVFEGDNELCEGDKYRGSSLVLNEDTVIKHYFDIADGKPISEKYEVRCLEGLDVDVSRNYVAIRNIAAKNLGTGYTIELISKEDQSISYKLKYSALSYANVVMETYENNPAKVNLVNVVKAMYKYYEAADEFFNK